LSHGRSERRWAAAEQSEPTGIPQRRENRWRPLGARQHAERMQITQVYAEDVALVDGIVALHASADAVDRPWRNALTARNLRGYITHGWDGEAPLFYAGLQGNQVVASGEIWLPMRDNRDNAFWTATVHPQRRRRGIGTHMCTHLEAVAKAQGRSVLGMEAHESDAASAFAVRHGYVLKYVGVIRRMTIAQVGTDIIEAAYAEGLAAATDYEVVRIAGPLTDEQIAESLPVVASINDAPTDDLVIEDEIFTPERLRAYDDAQLGRGARMYRVWARHRDTGEVAGHTVVAVEADRPHIGEQHDTTVLPKHRGHRLGLLLKADMVRWLRDAEPALQTITTDNAESNAHMIAVNERLGYRVLGRNREFQRLVS